MTLVSKTSPSRETGVQWFQSRAFFVYLFVKISKHNEKKVGLHFGNCGFLETTAAVMGRKLTESNSYHVASLIDATIAN